MKINLGFGIFLLFGIFLASYVLSSPALAQLPSATGIGVKIDTPADSASLPVGDLTIYGTSSDSNTTNCQVFADWNDLKPMQTVNANGPEGSSDYSKWSFTYTGSYHGITEGANELTSKITCSEQGQNASSKSYSINVTGIKATNEIANNNTQKSTEVVDTKDVANEDTNILPVNSNTSNTDSINNTVQSTEDVDVDDVSNEDVGSEDIPVLPIDNNKDNGTYKILPLYSESDEESTTSTSSEDSGQSYIRNMKTAGSQDGVTSTGTIDTGSGTYNTFSSDQQGTIDETNNMDMTSTEASDEGLASHGESNTFFTYEPDLAEDASNQNDVNTFVTSSDTGSSFSNHQIDDNSIFGLKFNGLDDVAQNKIEKRIEKLEDRITDRMSLFDLIG
ncbi:MAG TPA: hypothetical protein VD694_06425 [Nitrososphaeraceae archaeon]|nr:hypothetical protein [Nitrososphaeraceae archaeon]